MSTLFRPVVTVFFTLTLLTGVAYPLAVTGLSKVFFPNQAAGSLVVRDGKAVGSELIGQNFSEPKYFWGRPSATSPMAYNAAASSGSNSGPLNPALTDAIKGRVEALHAANPDNKAPVPVDLVTASASGLDPHISVAAALYQVGRVAAMRKLAPEAVQRLVSEQQEQPLAGLIGEARVNVLRMNLALDALR